jgi:hypothetical protein
MKQEHHEKDVKNNGTGAVYDINKELSSIENNGTYLDAHNFRISSSKGDKRAAEKIGGEEIIFPHVTSEENYECIGSIAVNGNIVEFWVSKDGSDFPLIKINGVVCGKSEKMPWLVEYPLQLDKNENCEGGEIFLTDNNTPPMILNVGDMIDSLTADPDKYFDGFNPKLYTVNLEAPLDIPVFKELVFLGGGGGLPVGSYQYSMRYVNKEGDRTNWGPLTNPIPVIQRFSEGSEAYPYANTYGGPSNKALSTSYGVKLKFRVTNLSNFDFIEIRRVSYNTAAGLDFVPGGEIIAQIEIENGETSVREFIDPVQSNIQEALTEQEETSQNTFIKRAKAIRYHDKRLTLMNVELEKQVAECTFKAINGKKIFPVARKLSTAGHKDPYNHHNFKNYTSGEKFSFGVSFYDSTGGRSFVTEDDGLKNIQAPGRRQVADADSQKYSYGGLPTAATDSGTVDKCFEIFDHAQAVYKDDFCDYKNIMKDRGPRLSGVTANAGKNAGDIDPYTLPFGVTCPSEAQGGRYACYRVGYNPYTPDNKNASTRGHNFPPNIYVEDDGDVKTYAPQAFGINYYSRGFALSGVDNIPSWAKAFSVVRTQPAKRVICQGLGMYALDEAILRSIGNDKLTTKNTKRLWFFSPDIESGIVNDSVIADISDNPQNYKVELISPLGFFSEVYDFEHQSLTDGTRSRCVDLASYARILRDTGQINKGESGVGIDGYVAYRKYRNTNQPATGKPTPYPISDFKIKTEGRGGFFEIVSPNSFYSIPTTSGENEFSEQGMKNFHEPFYIVNIIQEGASVIDQSIDIYTNTGAYQKIDSIIGTSDGTTNQKFELVDERWEDCIPSLQASHSMASDDVFVYIENQKGERRAYINVTYKSSSQKTTINNDITFNGGYIASNGTRCFGTYTHALRNNSRDFDILFNQGYTPLEDEKIIVSYDNRRPIQVYGGDSYVNEAVFSPIDRVSNGERGDSGGDDNDATTLQEFQLQIGWPFRTYHLNPRFFSIKRADGGALADRIQNRIRCHLTLIRQMIMLFPCESKSAIHYASSETYPLQYFPSTHYVIRPRRYEDEEFNSANPRKIAESNNLFPEYFDSYPREWLIWDRGGFRFQQVANIDYSVVGPFDYISKPEFGFEEENKLCTGVLWSLPRQINQQNSPGLKTFTSINRFDIDDSTGSIKYAWDASSDDKGSNLYAITEGGVCLLLTKKSILSNLSGDDLAQTSQDVFIFGDYWLSREVGCNDEMWRSIAESSVELKTESGRIESKALYMANSHSVYRLMNNMIMDIAKDSYFTRINPTLQKIKEGYADQISAVYDKNHNEYWLYVNLKEENKKEVFVFSQDTGYFVGTFGYQFDKFLFADNEMYGSRNLETYLLNKGYIMNGGNIEAFLIQKTSPQQPLEKEFIDFEVLTGPRGTMKPTRIEFMDENFTVLSALEESIQGPLYLKQYDGWRQFIPRKDESVDPLRSRIQLRLLLYKIIHNLAEDFKIVDSIIQYKPIK